MNVAERLGRYIDTTGPCHIWTGNLTRDGYARTTVRDKSVVVHRYLWEREHGPLGDDTFLDHLCRNRSCVNLAHLEPVTTRTNNVRGQVLVVHKQQAPYIGVRRMRDKFQARLTINRVSHHLGTFTTAEAAALAYDSAVQELLGPNAPTNQTLGLLKADAA